MFSLNNKMLEIDNDENFEKLWECGAPARYQLITQFHRYRHPLNFSRYPFQKTSSPGIQIANFPDEKYLGRHVIRN